MSRGLGRVQQAVLDALRQRGGAADLRTLVVDIFYPQDPEDSLDAGTHLVRYRQRRRRRREDYKQVQRAVVRLEALGLVRATQMTASALALVRRDEARWKEIVLVEPGPPPLLAVPLPWRHWVQQEGYRYQGEWSSHHDPPFGIEQWVCHRRAYPYLVVLVALDSTHAPLLIPCQDARGANQLITHAQTAPDLLTPEGIWNLTVVRHQHVLDGQGVVE